MLTFSSSPERTINDSIRNKCTISVSDYQNRSNHKLVKVIENVGKMLRIKVDKL